MLSYRKCTISDLEILTKVSKETFIDAFEKDNNPVDFQNYIQQAFSIKKITTELKNPNSHFYFVFDDNTLVGYFKLNTESAQTDVHDPTALEIERIYVLKEHQGKKIGAWMLQEIISLAHKMEKTFIWLGVWEHNTNAIRFYQRHGFQKFDEHPYFIGDDKQTDWLLRIRLKDFPQEH
ncbi:GNAT family N-acetyltransferase [Flagellimonas zhangzhouensis]|uniref:Ribosomal protein S18 acetylase RimI n=1 Tax=Flagellimonas zhangzhouensis TaxID=1073328 RepID=A0A1H2UM04_9FLAO|nr:GNAT family N-acetyltransferase [Allomuricauda zhangzhouensis]SDQ15791.1 Ribosomal protein S18 acetylase RimI [Allomuricauda zhangzhouensis]SDW57186.1 Ribosomal protein S18 acetylase RimI [Allomuricauda zhangzhouensis]